MATASTQAEVFYPESDGEPMGETIRHRDATIDLILGLKDWFADDPFVYVSGDEFLYYVEGQPRFVVSPDVWCVRGVDKTVDRPTYKTWEEGGKGPEVVVELTSKSTRRVDLGKKFRVYRDELKVLEYFLFDPLDEYLGPALQGYRLVEGEYRAIEPVDGRLPSEVLGLHLEADRGFVRLFDPEAGERLLTRLERLERLELAGQRKAIANIQKDALIREKDAAIRALEDLGREKDAVIRALEAAVKAQETTIRLISADVEKIRRELEALHGDRPPKKPKPKRK